MRPLRLLLALLALSALTTVSAPAASPVAPPSPWPAVTRENKPWTRWWWPGSAVDKASLTWQLEKLARAGVGGVEITPIYGANGYESRYLEFLSPQWMEMLEHTGREAQRLGLGVDMATGTGWPFGGPWITATDGLQRVALREGKLVGEPGKMMVKRAAPGGEGLVVDPFSPAALERYLAPFSRAFASFPRGLVRGQFHDSFEYFNANWTARLPEVFREMHGYDLQTYAEALTTRNAADVKSLDRDTLARIKADYRESLGRLHLDFLRTWIDWSHRHGFVVRNQSHGAPANLLDLYGSVDIPETEVFGSTPFPIPGLRRAADEVRHDQDLPESLVVRMASSAAHVLGRPLASSESATWLRDHWKESLAYTKPELDRILAEGINHIFFHGTVFSPQDAPWPGWLFYASTQFNPNNPWWDDFSALNAYLTRVQSVLQRGQPDNDILLYWPLADIWDSPDGLARMLTVHHVDWLTGQPVGRLARALTERGYGFDYISDAQLAQTRFEGGTLRTPGSRYQMILVPATRRMPVATLEKLAALARDGATVIFEKLPEDVPGFGRLESRRAAFRKALAQLSATTAIVRADPMATVATRVRRESLADSGLNFIRRLTPEGRAYFLTNLTAKPVQGWFGLANAARYLVLNPLDGRFGVARSRSNGENELEVFLQLAPGESLLLRASSAAATGAIAAWPVLDPAGAPVTLSGNWAITFLKGGPALPAPLQTTALKSWTELGSEDARRFAGTARYRLEFEAPAARADDWMLHLGDVRESARVRLDGRDLGTVWSLPMRVRLGGPLAPGRHVLELEVTNLAANRIRDMDARKEKWKIMREINFVNINYKPFDASGWPLTPSGLLGPVTLTPLRPRPE
ncbi:MAG: glycoside hydrolase [Verrucomicrobia bacterium]|nr:glycoside hydrolase [Verrucomicrobiota bacterium]